VEFDLWKMLGVSPVVGMTAAGGGLALAVLLALLTFWRNRTRTRTGGLSL
jgi:hypothetical protein